MSADQIQALINAVKSDSSLMERIKAAADIDAVVAIVTEAGYPDVFTKEEVMNAKAQQIQAQQAQQPEELGDGELEAVAGGKWQPWMAGWGWGGCNAGLIPSFLV